MRPLTKIKMIFMVDDLWRGRRYMYHLILCYYNSPVSSSQDMLHVCIIFLAHADGADSLGLVPEE